MDQYFRHTKGVSHQAGVLATGAAKTIQCIAGNVITALDRDLLDRVCHVLNGDLEISVCDLDRRPMVAGRVMYVSGQCLELLPDNIGVKRFVLIWTEDIRKEVRLQLAEHNVAVGHRERSAAAITGWPRIGAGALGAHTVARAVEEAD